MTATPIRRPADVEPCRARKAANPADNRALRCWRTRTAQRWEWWTGRPRCGEARAAATKAQMTRLVIRPLLGGHVHSGTRAARAAIARARPSQRIRESRI